MRLQLPCLRVWRSACRPVASGRRQQPGSECAGAQAGLSSFPTHAVAIGLWLSCGGRRTFTSAFTGERRVYWAVVLWSSGLATIAALNLLLWIRAAARLQWLSPALPDDVRRTRRLQLWLSAAYVLGCAFRSVLPVYDVPRLALIDSPLASVLVGRSVATVAELCFVAQWAVTLREASRMTGSVFGRVSSALVLPMIFTAELCSWYSVLTTSNLGHVFEESLW